MKIKTSENEILHGWIGEHGRFDLDGEHELEDIEYGKALLEALEQHPSESETFRKAWAVWTILTRNKASAQFRQEHGDAATSELAKWANASEAQSKAFNLLRGQISAVSEAYSNEANNLGKIFEEIHDFKAASRKNVGGLARVIAGGFSALTNKIELLLSEKKTRDEAARIRESHRDIIDWAWKLAVLGLLTLFAVRGNAQQVTQLRFGSTTLGSGYIDTVNTAIEVSCVVGCSVGTTDTDDNSVASGQSTGIQIGLGYVYNGVAWVRMLGDGTNGLIVQCNLGCAGGTQYTEDAVAAANPIGGAINLVRQDTPAGLVTTDGDNVSLRGTNYGAAFVQVLSSAGAFVDSFGGGTQYAVDAALGATPTGTLAIAIRDDALSALTPVEGDAIGLRVDATGALWVIPSGTTIVGGTVTVTDGAGALNVIVDSGTITSITNTVTVSDGAGALNVICDSGCGGPATFADNAAFTFGTTSIGITGYVFDDVAVNAATENSAAAPRMASNRVPYGIIRDGAGNERGANVTAGNALVVDGSGVTQPVSGTFWQATQPVSAASLPLPTGASTLAEQQTQTTALQLIDDGVYTDDTSTHATGTSKGYGIMAVAAPTDAAVNANDIGMVGMNVDRELYVAVSDPLPAGTNNIGDVDVSSFPDNEPINVAQINGVAVTMGNGISGTGVQRVTIASDSTGLVSVSESTAEDVAAAGAERLVRIGCVGNDADGTPFTTSGADGDYTHVACDRNGALMVTGQHPDQWSYHENSSSALTDTTVSGACGAGLYNYIGTLAFSSGAATQVTLLIEDSTTTTILGPYYLEAVSGRGAVINFNPPKKQTTANTLISITTTGAVAKSVDITGFCSP